MPLVQPYLGEIPEKILSFNRARGHSPDGSAIHFYIADAHFECVWNNPEACLQLLQ